MEQKIKIISYRGTPGKDAPDLRPFVQEQLEQLKATLTGVISSFQDSQNLANGIIDSDLREIENKISEVDDVLAGKVALSDFDQLQENILSFIKNINTSLANKATLKQLEAVKELIPEPLKVVSGSDNVQVTKENDTYTISVDFPEITREVTKEVISQGGGISKSTVEKLIDSAISEIPTPVLNLRDLEDVVLTNVENGQTLKYLNGNFVNAPDISGGNATWGNIIGNISNQADLQLALSDLTPLSTTSAISGNLQGQIDAIAQESTSIASSGGSILVTQNGTAFNLEVASAPIQNHNDLSGLNVGNYLHLTQSEYANISGAGVYVKKSGDTMTGQLTMSGAGIQLDLNHTPAHQEGKIFYDSVNHTLAYYNDNSEITVNVGQEQLVRVRNSNSTIANGKVVVVNGSTGNHPNIILADNTLLTAHDTIGVATHNINYNEDGYITVSGMVNGLNTSMYSTEGVTLWLGTSGNITETEPTAPNHKVKIGYLIRKHNNHGRILVAIDAGSDLKNLHDVSIGDYEDGALLVANGAVWSPGANVNDLATNSTVASISGSLQSQINSINVTSGTNISVTESPTNTFTVNFTGTIPTSATFLSNYDARYVNESDLTAGRLTLNAGLTVSAGTTALQALTCTTLAASGNGTFGTDTTAAGLVFNGAAGSVRSISTIQSAGVTRWGVTVRDATDDYRIRAYDDAGAAIDYPLTIARVAGGAVTLNRPLVVTGGTMTAPSSTQVIAAAGKLSCGDTSATSIQTGGGATLGSGKALTIGTTKVLGAQGAAVADATDAASVITQLNALLARCRAHGLIAT